MYEIATALRASQYSLTLVAFAHCVRSAEDRLAASYPVIASVAKQSHA